MFVLRCTKKLLARLGSEPRLTSPSLPPTSKLGHWHANLVPVGRKQLVLAVSDVTLLPVVLPIAPATTIHPRFVHAVAEVLMELGVDPEKSAPELFAMKPWMVGPTTSRQLLGTLNDFARMLDVWVDRPLSEAALELAKAPCSPIGMKSPDDLTRQLLA